MDIINLGWKKFDITPTVHDWYSRVPIGKLRLLIDCTGCGRHYVLHLFNKPLHTKVKRQIYAERYLSVNGNDLIFQWTQQRSDLNNVVLQKAHDVSGVKRPIIIPECNIRKN